MSFGLMTFLRNLFVAGMLILTANRTKIIEEIIDGNIKCPLMRITTSSLLLMSMIMRMHYYLAEKIVYGSFILPLISTAYTYDRIRRVTDIVYKDENSGETVPWG